MNRNFIENYLVGSDLDVVERLSDFNNVNCFFHVSVSLFNVNKVIVDFLQAPRRSDVNSLPQTLHWLPVKQSINYQLAVLTFKTQHTSSPQYLSQHISLRTSARNTRSSSVPLLCVPFRRTIRQTIVQHCRAPDLELTATCCVKLRLSLYFKIQT